MSKATIKTTVKKTKTRVKKDGSTNSSGYQVCSNCGGDGVVRKRKK